MEELVLRFPLVSQEIFKNLDNQDLTKFKEVSRFLKNYLKNDKSIWIRRLKKYNGNHVLHKETWISFMKNEPVEKIKTFVISVEQFYTKGRRIEYQHSPLHIVAECGNVMLFKQCAEKTGLINPKRNDGCTPFHFASQQGHLTPIRAGFSVALYGEGGLNQPTGLFELLRPFFTPKSVQTESQMKL